jgi:multiple sugar transport system permease protein
MTEIGTTSGIPGSGQVTLPPLPIEPERRRWWRPSGNPILNALYLVLLLGFSILFVYPFLWSISAALKDRAHVFDNKLIPTSWHWSNFVDIWHAAPVGIWFVNSMYIAVLAAVTVTLSSALTAFAFAYFRFPGRNFLFACVLGSLMLPVMVTMIPVYLIWNHLHLANSQYPLWASNMFGSAIYIFLLRQFFLGIPRELFEAARMDGDNYLTMFWRIVLPLAKPALIVVFVFEFKASWTNLLGPLIYLHTDRAYTISRGLKVLFDQYGPSAGGQGDYQLIMAGLVISVLPLIIIFFLGQRYFVEGIATQGRKG